MNLPMRGSPWAQRRQSADPRSPQLWSGPCQSAGCHSSAVRQPTIGGAAGGARPRGPDGAQRRAGPSYLSAAPGSRRQLADESRADLAASGVRPADLLLVIGDGLSSWAVERQAVPLIRALLPYLRTLGIGLAPVVLAHQSRVALGDDIGETLKARAVAILIGERPGLSSPDSLGVYLTWQPHRQRLESERNCISNIRPEGLSHDAAAFKLAWLLEQAFWRRLTGVGLKDESDNPALHGKIKPLPL